MKKKGALLILVSVQAAMLFSQFDKRIPETILPLELVRIIVAESSGELALQNEVILTGVNRNRPAEEYITGYFESRFILDKLREYGIREAEIIEVPNLLSPEEKAWDAETAELWIIEPELRKIADLKEVAASLSPGSSSADIVAELVNVGPGDEEKYYLGKDVSGKIVLVNGPPELARTLAVEKHGASGIVAYNVTAAGDPDDDRDRVGWNRINPSENEKRTFAFMVSRRTMNELRNLLDTESRVVLRAQCRTSQIPNRNEVVTALIKGSTFPEEELVFTAHLFEGFHKQGANDNASGSVAILETARVIHELQATGRIPPLRRSIRFLFVPEISGTASYMEKYKDIAGRFFANINEDMVGEALVRNHSHFCLKRTPWSVPSYLNDVLESLFEWMGITNRVTHEARKMVLPVVSPTGSRDPFYYMIDDHHPASDHTVFLYRGHPIPAVMLIAFPDFWQHTSQDTPDKSDSTQLKRAVVISVASAVFLANAQRPEYDRMIVETSGRGMDRLSVDKLRADRMILLADPPTIHESYKESRNLLEQAFEREEKALLSINALSKTDKEVFRFLNEKIATLKRIKARYLQEMDDSYSRKCRQYGASYQKPGVTREESRLQKLIPIRTTKMLGFIASQKLIEETKDIMDFPISTVSDRIELEVRNFIDGRRSILDIRNAVSAEFWPIPLPDIEQYIKILEQLGYVTIRQQ